MCDKLRARHKGDNSKFIFRGAKLVVLTSKKGENGKKNNFCRLHSRLNIWLFDNFSDKIYFKIFNFNKTIDFQLVTTLRRF